MNILPATWIPVARYRGQLVREQCPCCGFLIACLLQEDPWDGFHGQPHGLHLGRKLHCMRCGAMWREEIWT